MRDELRDILFRAAYLDSEDAVAALDSQRRIRAWSRGAAELLGVSAEDAAGAPFESFFHDPRECENAFEAAAHQGAVRHFEVRLSHKDGSVERTGLSLRILGDPPAGFIARLSPAPEDLDTSPEQRPLQESLVRMERFSTLGRVTAAFAHEMRTPLHVISSTAELAIEDAPEPSRIREDLTMILRNANQATSSILALLEFAKTGKSRLREDSLNAVVESVLRWMEKLCQKQGVELVTELDELGPILIDPNHLRSVLHNILVNAVEAMPGGGTLTVVTKSLEKGGALLTVGDSGPGMPEAVLEKATTPFFTTKEDGTGLGLYLAKRVLQEHGASLDFSCPEPGGTLVSVLFPPSSAS
jgi:PAS domain S-box-containing protein